MLAREKQRQRGLYRLRAGLHHVCGLSEGEGEVRWLAMLYEVSLFKMRAK